MSAEAVRVLAEREDELRRLIRSEMARADYADPEALARLHEVLTLRRRLGALGGARTGDEAAGNVNVPGEGSGPHRAA